MTGPPDDEAELAAALGGIDGPRAVPQELADELTALLSPGDPVADLAARGADAGPVPVPGDLDERLVAIGSASMPSDMRDRLEATLTTATRAGRRRSIGLRLPIRTDLVLRAAAVVLAVALVGGGLAFAANRAGDDQSHRIALDATSKTGGAGVDRLPIGPSADDLTAATTIPESPTTTAAAAPTTTKPGRTNRKVPAPAGDGHLVAFSSCDDLLGRTKAAALAVVGPYGLDDGRPRAGRAAAATAAPSSSSSSETADEGNAPAASTTNNQEAGVDEPDIVKSDGRRIVTLTDRAVRVLRVDGGRNLSLTATLMLPDRSYASSLLVDGDRALVIGRTSEGAPPPDPPPGSMWFDAVGEDVPRSRTTVWTIDLRDPAHPQIESTLVLDGDIATARLVDGKVRVVLTTTAIGPEWVYAKDGSADAQREATEENRRRIEASTLDDWTPRYTLLRGTDPATARTGRLCACDDTLRPATEFAGSSTISVLTLDPQRSDDPPSGSAAVQGWASTVYASKTNLYVTTHSFARREDGGAPTAVHRFDITGANAVYRGSGEVRGYPLNQFALSEWNGHLRVATTDDPVAVSSGSSASFVSALALRADRLEPVGVVGDLGKGERIYAVRFLDDVGYVVTFRQIDPLYTVDLADPTKPRIVGELKTPGASEYLHPLGDGRLLGVGIDATDDGRATGAQVSTFDVRAPDAPTQIGRVSYGANSWSPVPWDHHGFLWWPAARRAMVPLQTSDGQTSRSWMSVVDVGADGQVGEAGRLTHDGRGRSPYAPILRSFVIGDTVFTLSNAGILASDLGSLADESWLAFG